MFKNLFQSTNFLTDIIQTYNFFFFITHRYLIVNNHRVQVEIKGARGHGIKGEAALFGGRGREAEKSLFPTSLSLYIRVVAMPVNGERATSD